MAADSLSPLCRAEDELGAIFSDTDDHEDGNTFYALADSHPEVDAINKEVLEPFPGEVTGSPGLYRLLQFGGRVAHFRCREGSPDQSLGEKGEGPRADAGEIHGGEVFGDPVIVALCAGEDLGLKVAVPIPGDPDLDIADALDAEGPGVAAVPVIRGAILSLVLLSVLYGR